MDANVFYCDRANQPGACDVGDAVPEHGGYYPHVGQDPTIYTGAQRYLLPGHFWKVPTGVR